jgi:hypothetical protein
MLITADPERLAQVRTRLSNVSWFMRCLVEPIARQAKREDTVLISQVARSNQRAASFFLLMQRLACWRLKKRTNSKIANAATIAPEAA